MAPDAEVCPVRVVARFRPPIAVEEREETSPAFVVEHGVIESSDHLHCFRLDSAFGEETNQEMVYEEVGRPVVQDVLSGYNGTILAYGPTGSGKTFCMFGPHGRGSPESAGLVPRAVQQVLDFAGTAQPGITLHCSFFEVYLEKVRDFLGKTPNAQLKESPGSDGLTYRKITTAGEALQILRLGLRLRVAANTRLNEHSSRSHAIFSLVLRQEDSTGIRQRKLTLVDLAGSEKVWQSGSVGGRLEEAKKINSSLSALGHVIEALAGRRSHVPFRDSRLTRLLEDSLGGNCRTTLLVACSPSQLHCSETLSSLRFAARAKKIENMVGIAISPLDASPLSTRRLERRIAQLRRELTRLENRRAGLRGDKPLSEERRRTPSPSPGERRGSKTAKTTFAAISASKEVPEALPLPASAASSYRSTATGTSSTASVVAASAGSGSASGTPLSRDPEAAESSAAMPESPRVLPPPSARGGYSFIIEATPVECHPSGTPKPLLTQGSHVFLEAAGQVQEDEVATTSAALERHAAALSQRCAALAAKLAKERQRCSRSVHAEMTTIMATPIRKREQRGSDVSTPMEVRGRSTASCASRLASCFTGSSNGGDRPRPSQCHQVWIPRDTASMSPVRALSPSSPSPGAKSGRVLSQYLFSIPDGSHARTTQVSTSSPLRRASRPLWSGPSGHVSVNRW